MMIQIIQQMLGKKLDLVPHVSFGEAIDWRAAQASRRLAAGRGGGRQAPPAHTSCMAGVEPDVRVFTDAESLSQAAASIFTETVREAISQRGRFLVCLSGGDSPKRTYSTLARKPQRDLVEWSQVQFFWGDERCVPAEDLNSNYRRLASFC